MKDWKKTKVLVISWTWNLEKNDVLLWKWILPEFKMHVDNIFVYVYTCLLKFVVVMFTFSIFLLKNLPDGGRTWIYHDHLMHCGTNPKPKAEGSRTSPEYLPLVSTSSRYKKSKNRTIVKNLVFLDNCQRIPNTLLAHFPAYPLHAEFISKFASNFPKGDGQTSLQATTLATKWQYAAIASWSWQNVELGIPKYHIQYKYCT